MKKVTQEDVFAAASALILLDEDTTSLEVKEALRRDGFWATQEVVGGFLRALAKEGKLVFSHNKQKATRFGYYRVYKLAEPTPDPVADPTAHNFGSTDVCQNDGCGLSKGYVTAFGKDQCEGSAVIADAKARLNIGTFRVSSANGLYVSVFTDVTRGQAKWLWVKAWGLPFFEARTVRVDK